MIVKGYKDIYKGVSERLDIPYEMVELIGNFTWNKLAESIDDFRHRETYLFGLGSFRFRKKKSIHYINRMKYVKEKMLKMGRPLEHAEKAEQRVNDKIAKMKRLNKEWDEIAQARKDFKIKRVEYDANRNIQEQSSNLGGTKESNI